MYESPEQCVRHPRPLVAGQVYIRCFGK